MFIKAVFLLVGTTIGAGIFALPYVFIVSGIPRATIGLCLLTLITLALNLYYVRIIEATNGDHQLPGYASHWLGSKGKWLALVSIILSCWGAMIAYVVLGGNFLALVAGQQESLYHPLLFFLLGSVIVLRGLKTISSFEEYLTAILLVASITIPILGVKYADAQNLVSVGNHSWAFYGPILFALSGTAVIPEMNEILTGRSFLLKKAVSLGTLIPAAIYLVFAVGIAAVSGQATSNDALSGLLAWSPSLVYFGAIVGLLATFTSFIALANVLGEVFCQDLKLPQRITSPLAIALPFGAVFIAPRWFTTIISLSGSVTIGLTGIVISLIAWKLLPRESWQRCLLALIIVVLMLGMAKEL